MTRCSFKWCEFEARYVTDDPFNASQKFYACQQHYRGLMASIRGSSSGMGIKSLPPIDMTNVREKIEIMRSKP